MDGKDVSEMDQEVLELQIHSIPLDLNWTRNKEEEEEEEEDDDDDVQNASLHDSTQAESRSLLTKPDELLQTVDLNQPSTSKPERYKLTSEVEDYHGEISDDEELIDLSAHFEPTTVNLLKLNFAYQEVIEQQLAKVDQLLQENHYNTSVLMESMDRASKATGRPPKIEAKLLRRQFFRDEQGYGPPNVDTKRRLAELGPHFTPDILPSPKWKKTMEKALIAGIERDARRLQIEPILSQLEYLHDKYKKNESLETKKKIEEVNKKMENTRNMQVSELVNDRERKWDWDSITNIELQHQQTPSSCELYWKNSICPSINKTVWSKEEHKKLSELVSKHKNLDWNVITAELGTNRTPVEVLRKYQLKLNTSLRSRPWTPEEDELLTNMVNKYRVGNCIPYTKISYHVKDRSSTQVVHRWTKSVNPDIKRTKFTAEEDAQLYQAVLKYGQKWSLIRDLDLVPNRHDSQLRERYVNCLIERKRGWNKTDDEKLIKVVDDVGEGNWSLIAQQMGSRTDCQCMRRWKTIKDCVKKGSNMRYMKNYKHRSGVASVRRKLKEVLREENCSAKIETQNQGNLVLDPSSDQRRTVEIEKVQQRTKAEVLKDYQELMKARKQFKRRVKSAEDIKLDEEICQLIGHLYRPLNRRVVEGGNPICTTVSKVRSNSVNITPKSIFIHFIKALNINAEMALDSIKNDKKKKIPKKVTQIKIRDLLVDQLAQEDSKDSRKRKLPPFVTNDATLSGSEATSQKATPQKSFARNLYLPLCAPNRATIRGYRELSRHRETRVKRAKSILDLPQETSDGTDEEEGNSTAPVEEGKFKTEQLLIHLRATYKYKILRSRFNSLFTWPTLLASLLPYTRRQSDKVLVPAVRTRRNFKHEEDVIAAKKQKLS